MGFFRVLFIIVLVIHIIGSIGYVAFALAELPYKLRVTSPAFLVPVCLSLFTVFADAIGILLLRSATKLVGRPNRRATEIAAYIIIAIAAVGHLMIVFLLVPYYIRANTVTSNASNPANDVEWCCVFYTQPDCPGIACTAGHKTQPYQLRIDWRFLVLFWMALGMAVLEAVMMLLVSFTRKATTVTTLGVTSQSSSPITSTTASGSSSNVGMMSMEPASSSSSSSPASKSKDD